MGLFIPLPLHLARKFPSLLPDDSSPSHVTLLYIGEVPEEKQARLLEVLRETCARFYWKEAEAVLGELDYFDHGDRVVPHVSVLFDRDFGAFRRVLKQDLRSAGFPIVDKYVKYRPHVTLDYLDPEEEWEARVPKGTWSFDEIEVWGLPEVHRIPLGRPKLARLRDLQRRLALLEHRATRLVVSNLGDQIDAAILFKGNVERWLERAKRDGLPSSTIEEFQDILKMCQAIHRLENPLVKQLSVFHKRIQDLGQKVDLSPSQKREIQDLVNQSF